MQDNQEKCKELAIRIYNLDEEVYKCVGSSLGRTFTNNYPSSGSTDVYQAGRTSAQK